MVAQGSLLPKKASALVELMILNRRERERVLTLLYADSLPQMPVMIGAWNCLLCEWQEPNEFEPSLLALVLS